MIDLDRLIESANDLAPFPASTVRLAQLVSSPECDLNDVADVIAYDPALTVKLLRAANAGAHAGATRAKDTKQAIGRLGTAQVFALAVAAGARPQLQAQIPAYGLAEGALWRHSVAAAAAAETAPAHCGTNMPPEAFTAALLHDVGKLVMGRFLDEDDLHFLQRAREEGHLSAMEAETILLGVHHGELGGLIAQHWQLPARVVIGITYHHNPDEGHDSVCDFTYLAEQFTRCIEAEDDPDETIALQPTVVKRLGTSPERLADFRSAARRRFTHISDRYNAV